MRMTAPFVQVLRLALRPLAFTGAPVVLLLAAACGGGDGAGGTDPDAPASAAFGIWSPGAFDTCTKEQHDAYFVVGPDGKKYPTWHPPTGPGGCTFGHDHGRDPRGSDLFGSVGNIPFGLANEALLVTDPANPRHEDHVGHKVEWENDIELRPGGSAGNFLSVRCDVLTKLHQGTHSKDAFTNNVHEIVQHLKCSDGSEMGITMLTAIGNPGEFRSRCTGQVIQAGQATPLNSPRGGGVRIIPERSCVERHMLVADGQRSDYGAALHENWETSQSIRRADGSTIAHFNNYYQVRRPSRYYDPTQPNNVGRPMADCYATLPDGRRARGGDCAAATQDGSVTGITYDDPRSPFNGASRFVDVNGVEVNNAGGPEFWYTDAYGRNGQPQPFPGSVRQRVSRNNSDLGGFGGPVIGNTRDYGGPGVRAPN